MKRHKYQLILPIIFGIMLLIGCSSKSQSAIKKNSEKSTAKVIAVMPVDNKSLDVKAPQLLRLKVLDELYFKGYSKLPLEVIDKKLELSYNSEKKSGAGVVSPQLIKELVGADAAMYCTLTEGKRTVSLFYAPVTIAARCELRSTQTGEVLWNARYKSTSRNFDFTSKRLEMKSCESFETVIEEVVNKVLESMPDGPNLNG
jgi:hypothetical protein